MKCPSRCRRAVPTSLLLPAMVAVVLLAGCWRGAESSRPPIHPNPNMDRQPKLLAQQSSDFFFDGAAMQPPVPGTVAREDVLDPTVTSGRQADGAWVETVPLPVDDAFLARGVERYGIYCTPCHGDNGKGKGILFTYASFQCADLAQDRLVQMTDGELFGILTHGVGMMPSFRSRLPVADRWAIITYLREIQDQNR